MKQQLRKIYDDLCRGALTRGEALESIKALKLNPHTSAAGVLLASPFWHAEDAAPPASKNAFAAHYVIACELPSAAALLPQCHWLSLPAIEGKHIAERYTQSALACYRQVRAVLGSHPQGKVLMQIAIADVPELQLLTGLSSLLQTASLENPQFVGQLILMPIGIEAEDLTRRLQAEQNLPQDKLVRYASGQRHVLRWQEQTADQQTPPIAFKNDGVYLITGGLGALGVLFAQEILSQAPQAKVVLTGRSALDLEKQRLLDSLGMKASYRRLDLRSLEHVEQCIAAILAEYGQLDGILHTAGMMRDNFILKKNEAEFLAVLQPKVSGTYHLDQATQQVKLDFFVLFSSLAGVAGNAGQADYAAANGFMDQFAAQRNREAAAGLRYGRTRSINWGLWQAGGMRMDAVSWQRWQQATGIQPMQTYTGMQAFHRSLALPHDQLLVLEGDVTRMREAFLASVPAAADTIKTQQYLCQQFSEWLRLPLHQLDPHAGMEQYGMDSILAMKLTSHLEQIFGPLPMTLFFEYQTIAELTAYFTESHADRLTSLFVSAAKPPEAPAHRAGSRRKGRRFAPEPKEREEGIAIVGLSGRYPEAENLAAYWQNLRAGKDCIVEVPRERWDWHEYFSEDRNRSGHHYSKWGGFIAGVDQFDPLFFNIAPKDAKYIDPQERLFLQHAWMAIEDAGYTRASLQAEGDHDLPGQVGVYVGMMYSEYQLFGVSQGAPEKRVGIAGSAAGIANRVSYTLNLHGPSMTVDTMCSSSLTAIHLACQDLKQGRTSMALAGGVNVSVHPNKYLVLSAGQFISSDGHCQSFGQGGDGYIPGEGVGVVVLKRLADAERDGDHIYGIVRGSAINHGGKTNGYTVPNPQAQSSAVGRALAEAQIDARAISYVEAHGTGTRLGDPIEIAALTKAFRQFTQETGSCLIGSVKSNIGHCESAAGMAGLTKVLLQMQHQQIVPSLHATELNPHIDFSQTPFVVNQTLRGWEQPVVEGRRLPRIAGISSFGAGGSNAHLIVEEYPSAFSAPGAATEAIIPLSARTVEQLKQKALDLLEFLQPRLQTLDVRSLAYTLQTGREEMDERVGFVASSGHQLAEKLAAFAAGERDIPGTYQGNGRSIATEVDLQSASDNWVDLWVRGAKVPWSTLYGQSKPQRMSLPTYPFARDRYWVEPSIALPQANTILHPFLHSNTSTLDQQRYRSTFAGDEPFLRDYQLAGDDSRGRTVLPWVVCLEMAQSAVNNSQPARGETSVLELRQLVWAPPAILGEDGQASIALWAQHSGEIEYQIYTKQSGADLVLCQGVAGWRRAPSTAALDLEKIHAAVGPAQPSKERVYAAWRRSGMIYGPAYESLEALYCGHRQVLAQLQLPSKMEDYVLHPALIEGSLQAAMGLIEFEGGEIPVRLPHSLESLSILSPCSARMLAWIRHAQVSRPEEHGLTLDIDLCNEQGVICVQMRGLECRPVRNDLVETLLLSPEADGSDVLPAITATLRSLLANELQMHERDVSEHLPFIDLGLDSITGVTWVRKINDKYKTSIEAINLYTYSTLAQLSRHVREEAAKQGTPPLHKVAVTIMNSAVPRKLTPWREGARPRAGGLAARASIAVVGMAGKFPQADNLAAFWQNISLGRNCIRPVPSGRWDADAYYQAGKTVPGKTNCKWFGALEDYDRFDPLFFNISPKEAESMDPQQRLLLQSCWHTIESAGYDARSLSRVKCGVFVGCAHGDYHLLSREQQLSAQGFTGDATSILAGRISYFLNLHGPCLSIDTACSSSLVALASGCDSLMSGDSDMALAGGVYVMAGPEMHIKTAQAGMLSTQGKCFAFDQRADGFVPGEGVGAVLLKRLDDAERDGDIIYGVIEGWGVNQDGKTNGITAPNAESQTRLEQQVYDKYHIDPATIQLLEAHGTGTKLGDPIEVQALKNAFAKYTRKQQYCALASVKSNIGHCLTAAGMAGFLKLMLAFQHRQLPPTINVEQLNEHIDLTGSPFYINRQLQEWKLEGSDRRRAAISSLGFSGTNAHFVVSEYVSPEGTHAPSPLAGHDNRTVIPLSARTAGQLQQRARDLVEFLAGRRDVTDLRSLAYTLQVGREPMEERVGLVVSSREELVSKLAAYIAGEEGIENVFAGKFRGNKELLSLFSTDSDLQHAVERWIAGRKLTKLVELWANGLEVEWGKLYEEGKPQRMSLPLYPFARERYWIGSTAVPPPQVHHTTTDVSDQPNSTVLVDAHTAALREPREVVFLPAGPVFPALVAGKPTRIALPSPRVVTNFAIKPKQPIRLSQPMSIAAAAISVRVYDEGEGIFSVEIAAGDSNAMSQLLQALERVGQQSPLKVLKLRGLEHCILREHPFYGALVSFPCPVIGILHGDVIGAGWLAAALCDLLVCNEAARYGYSGSELEASVLKERFGPMVFQGMLYGGQPATGMQLRSQGILCAVLAAEQIEPYAQTLAVGLAAKTHLSLRLLKEHLARPMVELVARMNTVAVTEAPAPLAETVLQIQWNGIDSFLAELQGHGKCKAVVVVFARDAVASEAVVEQFQQVVWELDVPVVAALQAGAVGAGWLMTHLCDGCVYSRTGSFAAETIGHSAALGATAAASFVYRLGSPMATEVLLTGAAYSGAELQRRVGALRVGKHDQVVPMAMELATHLARRGAATLRQNIAKAQVADIDERTELPVPEENVFSSNVVTVTAYPQGIVVVKMEDREAKNMFSDALLHGMTTAFAHIAHSSEYKVVILTGYDSYFSCGGTKENLLSIQAGKVRFTDHKMFQLPLDCKLPVIAAMQGHGIGAGWSLGMFADVVLLSEESRYESPYMNYGFTPGAGATWVLGEKLGLDLARESLFTANQYAGSELKARGLRLRIVPRVEVEAAAMQLASQIARWPRRDLMALKQRLTAHIPALLEHIYRGELAMHDQTFVGQSETLAQIESHFRVAGESFSVPVAATRQTVNADPLSTITANLRALLAEELHLQERDIDPDVEFIDLGLDSISGVTWIRRINEKYQTSLEATKLYSYPTLSQLSRFIKQSMPANQPAEVAVIREEKLTSWPRRRERSREAPEAIAVIGMSGQFPQAKNLGDYWQNLAQGRNCISEIPLGRWDVHRYYDPQHAFGEDKVNSKWLGVLDDVDCFDPLFFRISPQEAEYVDPQHRLFLQESYKAFEDAGYCAATLGNTNCGVYLGISAHEYPLLLAHHGLLTMPITSNSNAIAAGRIAYHLNLKGPAIAVDTACSSSLVSIHLACQALWSGETDMALAGGVTVWLNPATFVSMCQSGGISSVGLCKTFDDAADGIVLSEGVGAVVLKRLSDAQADNDFIHGVILGSGINQDGRTNGITAPSVLSQAQLERSVYDKFQIDPATITYVETHGAGGALGDPIELEALATAFKEKTTQKNYCALGSAKSNIGHTAAASGVAGTIKALLSLEHRTLVPVLNVSKENTHFDFKNSPFYICKEKQPWVAAPGVLRRAAVSSFGYSGTNAHLVLEEYVAAAAPRCDHTHYLIPLSARTTEQLRQRALDLVGLLRSPHSSVNLASIAYTLQTGRDAMEERMGCVVSTIDQLAEILSVYGNGMKQVEGVYEGRISSGLSALAQEDNISGKRLIELLELWVRGRSFDWNKLYGPQKPQRIPLPTYPFAKQRCWVPEKTSDPEAFDLNSIEDIIRRVDADIIEPGRAVDQLRYATAAGGNGSRGKGL